MVSLVRHKYSGKQFALKTVHMTKITTEPRQTPYIELEVMETLSAMGSVNCVKTYETFRSDRTYCIVMKHYK